MITHEQAEGKFLAAKTWARRWDCSIASVRRAARRFGVKRVYVGQGPNGLVRYDLRDIERIEAEQGIGQLDDTAVPAGGAEQ
jgi:hypothetical protein